MIVCTIYVNVPDGVENIVLEPVIVCVLVTTDVLLSDAVIVGVFDIDDELDIV